MDPGANKAPDAAVCNTNHGTNAGGASPTRTSSRAHHTHHHVTLPDQPRPLNSWRFKKASNFSLLEAQQAAAPELHRRSQSDMVLHNAPHVYLSSLTREYSAALYMERSRCSDSLGSDALGDNADESVTAPLSSGIANDTAYTIPISRQGPEYFAGAPQDGVRTLCIIMVGLPARGKTFLAQKICRLLGWHGCRAKVLNVQVAWRRLLLESGRRRASLERTGTYSFSNVPEECNEYIKAEQFRALVSNPSSVERTLYRHVLELFSNDARTFFETGGEVLVLNDDFPTEELRDEAERFFSPLASQTFFMEVIRGDKVNARFNKFKVRDISEYPPGVNATEAAEDFARRVSYLHSVYTTLTPVDGCSSTSSMCNENGITDEFDASASIGHADNGPTFVNAPSKVKQYIKLLDHMRIEVHGITGYTASRIVSYMMNLSQLKVKHPIYFTRHGESEYNLEDRIGGNPPLTAEGRKGAYELLSFLSSLKAHYNQGHDPDQSFQSNSMDFTTSADGVVEIWTSQLRRAIQTVEHCECSLGIKVLQWSSLNEIHAGVCEDYTYAEVRDKYPLIDQFRKLNKYTFRYPEGESYQDLVMRLEPVIMELENADRVIVVVAHQAVLRGLLAYFGSTSAESCVRLEVPHRTVWRCTYDSKGIASLDELRFEEEYDKMNENSV